MKTCSSKAPYVKRKSWREYTIQDRCLLNLSRCLDLRYKAMTKHYFKPLRIRHGPRPPIEDDLDRFLWSYEKWKDAQQASLRKICGPVFYCPQSAEDILNDQNNSFPTMALLPLPPPPSAPRLKSGCSFHRWETITDNSATVAPPMARAV